MKTISDEDSLGVVNASKGLRIPRVLLTKKNDLTNILASPSAEDNVAHIGLLVYAIEQFGNNPVNSPRLYVWSGAE